MMTIADRAALYCRRHPDQVSTVERAAEQSPEAKESWRRIPRTRAAIKARQRAVDAAIRFLRAARIPFTEPVRGKLVVPPTGWRGARVVTFWPARKRLRLGKRPTMRGHDLDAFREALADNGNLVPGIPFRRPGNAKRIAKEERYRARLEAKLMKLERRQAGTIKYLADWAAAASSQADS